MELQKLHIRNKAIKSSKKRIKYYSIISESRYININIKYFSRFLSKSLWWQEKPKRKGLSWLLDIMEQIVSTNIIDNK